MAKRLLIISPHFPPVNAADMHRVRQMLPYLQSLGWEAEVMTVDPAHIESYSNDPLLNESVPSAVRVHRIPALKASLTRKFGLGSLSMRSYYSYKKKGGQLIRKGKFDLVFFSTTAFHVMALGPYWKKKFGVPFVLDIQDPWRNDFYLSKPPKERPPKFFIAWSIDKILEARTIPHADAIISVSKGYCDTFRERYPAFRERCCHVIPFGAVPDDFDVLRKLPKGSFSNPFDPRKINVVYIGRGGYDMQHALVLFFSALKEGLREYPELFGQIHCWFMGTSYAVKGAGVKTIEPVAERMGMASYVTEITDRLPYYQTLFLLKKADMLFIPGSTDTQYTASKIFSYILAEKPLLACFHQDSSVLSIMDNAKSGQVVAFSGLEEKDKALVPDLVKKIEILLRQRGSSAAYDRDGFEPYTAGFMTKRIVRVFDGVLKGEESVK